MVSDDLLEVCNIYSEDVSQLSFYFWYLIIALEFVPMESLSYQNLFLVPYALSF